MSVDSEVEAVKRNRTNGEIPTISATIEHPPDVDEKKTDYRFLFIRVVVCAAVLALIIAMIVVTITGEVDYEDSKTASFGNTTTIPLSTASTA